jgi:hypothetical protein
MIASVSTQFNREDCPKVFNKRIDYKSVVSTKLSDSQLVPLTRLILAGTERIMIDRTSGIPLRLSQLY